MRFETLEEYDDELNEMKEDLSRMKEYIEKHPDELGTKGNYEGYEYIYNLFRREKIEFITQLNQINLKLTGNLINDSLTPYEFHRLSDNLKNLTINFKSYCKTSEGCYRAVYEFQNPSEEDLKRQSRRKKELMKLFDFIECGDDIDKLKKEAEPDGENSLKKYREFLKEIIEIRADFTLDTEMGTLKAGLTLNQCKNICKKLNI